VRAQALAALLLSALPLAACAPKAEEAPSPPAALDCGKSFEALKAEVLAQKLTPSPKDSAEPYRFYTSEDGKTSYLITAPDAPAHPAVMRQQAANGQVTTTGCRYGDAAAYDQLFKYLDGLKSWRRS
jgi:hypothetical protein